MFDVELSSLSVRIFKIQTVIRTRSINLKARGAKIPTQMNIGTNYKMQRTSHASSEAVSVAMFVTSNMSRVEYSQTVMSDRTTVIKLKDTPPININLTSLSKRRRNIKVLQFKKPSRNKC